MKFNCCGILLIVLATTGTFSQEINSNSTTADNGTTTSTTTTTTAVTPTDSTNLSTITTAKSTDIANPSTTTTVKSTDSITPSTTTTVQPLSSSSTTTTTAATTNTTTTTTSTVPPPSSSNNNNITTTTTTTPVPSNITYVDSPYAKNISVFTGYYEIPKLTSMLRPTLPIPENYVPGTIVRITGEYIPPPPRSNITNNTTTTSTTTTVATTTTTDANWLETDDLYQCKRFFVCGNAQYNKICSRHLLMIASNLNSFDFSALRRIHTRMLPRYTVEIANRPRQRDCELYESYNFYFFIDEYGYVHVENRGANFTSQTGGKYLYCFNYDTTYNKPSQKLARHLVENFINCVMIVKPNEKNRVAQSNRWEPFPYSSNAYTDY